MHGMARLGRSVERTAEDAIRPPFEEKVASCSSELPELQPRKSRIARDKTIAGALKLSAMRTAERLLS
jgi:hypothetical protein